MVIDMNLTERQLEVLENLDSFCKAQPNLWARTMDVGGRDASYHSKVLGQLVEKGLAQRGRYRVQHSTGHWRYRITARGQEVLWP